jgi:hypothetical protein
MASFSYFKDDQYVLNYCTKYLSRFNMDSRHSYGQPGMESPRDRVAEAWRFPVIDSYGGGASAVTDPETFRNYNDVSSMPTRAPRRVFRSSTRSRHSSTRFL